MEEGAKILDVSVVGVKVQEEGFRRHFLVFQPLHRQAVQLVLEDFVFRAKPVVEVLNEIL